MIKNQTFTNTSENSYPHVWLDNLQIVGGNYGNCTKRKIGEALLINELKPTLNKINRFL